MLNTNLSVITKHCLPEGHKKSLKMLYLLIPVLLCALFPASPVHAEDAGTEAQVKKIREEYTALETSSFTKLLFIKNENNVWQEDDRNTQEGEAESFHEAALFVDDRGMIRKFEYINIDVGLDYRKKEYFLEDGTLFFVYAKEIQGGSGNWWEARLYFYKDIIIRNNAESFYLEQMKEYSPVVNGHYRNPQKIGYHLHAKDIMKEFGITVSILKNKLSIAAETAATLTKTRVWFASKGRSYDLETLQYITRLDLSSIEVNDDEMAYLKPLARLQWLDLHGSCVDAEETSIVKKKACISDKGLASLSTLKNLRNLNLGGTKITDKGLIYLKELRNIEELDVRNTGLTDNGVEYLGTLKNLKVLYLYGTGITETGLHKLENLLPECEIYLLGA